MIFSCYNKNGEIVKKVIIGLILVVIIGGTFLYIREIEYQSSQVEKLEQVKKEKEEKLKEIKNNYNKYVIVNKDTNLYTYNENRYQKSGKVVKDITFELEELDESSEYYKIKNLNKYIYYKDVSRTENLVVETIYKNYVPFNLNIITKNAKFYKDDKVIFELNDEEEFKVLGKSDTLYYIELNNMFLSVKKEDVVKEYESHNTDLESATDIAVLNYHFFYDKENGEVCNQIICHEKQFFKEQLDYLKNNNFFTTDMESFSMFLDGIIKLPKKTVLLTIDDGGQGVKEVAIPMLTEYQMNATVFLVTSWYNPNEYENEYIECHSHTNNMHNDGVCPMEQGGGLTCLSEEEIKNDLQASRNILNGSTAIAYPFYEYNDYAIEQLKNNGFKLAFIDGGKKASVGCNKFLIPRYVMSTNWNINDFISAVN